MHFCNTRLLAEVEVDPTIVQAFSFESHERFVWDSIICKVLVSLLYFPLEPQALKYFFTEAISKW